MICINGSQRLRLYFVCKMLSQLFPPSTWLNIKRWNQAMFNSHQVSWRSLMCRFNMQLFISFGANSLSFQADSRPLYDYEKTSQNVLGVEVLCLYHIYPCNPENPEWMYMSTFVKWETSPQIQSTELSWNMEVKLLCQCYTFVTASRTHPGCCCLTVFHWVCFVHKVTVYILFKY